MEICPKTRCGSDTSVTATVLFPWHRQEKLVSVPEETIERVTGYLRDQAFDERRGGFGYQEKDHTIACTAGGVYSVNLQAIATPSGSRPP